MILSLDFYEFDDNQWETRSTSSLHGADRQPQYSSNYTLKMALWFVSYAMSPIVYNVSIVIVYNVSIVIVYGLALLLSMMYQFQSFLGKNDCMDL